MRHHWRSHAVEAYRAMVDGWPAHLLHALAVFASFVVILLGFASNASAAEEGRITGRVTDAATQAGIEGLEVCARLRSERLGGHCARTGQNGEYTIPQIPAGSYIVEFLVPFQDGPGSSQSDLDYASQYYDGEVGQAEAEEVTVTGGESKLGIDAAMRPGGMITGVVIDAVTRDRIAGLEVCAYRPLVVEDPPSRCGTTDADGEYAIDPLVSGEYVVVFRVPSNGPLDYAPQYYNDQASAEQTNEVPVTIGGTTPGIDAAMQSGGGIAGQVTVAATGNPLMNAEVCAFSVAALSAGGEAPERCVQTNVSGEYVLSQLTSGQDIVEFYDQFGVGFVRQYYDGKSSRAEATPLSVTSGVTITDVDASLHEVGEETVKPSSPTETTLSTNLAFVTPLLPKTPIAAIVGSKLVVTGGSAPVRVACSHAACQGSIELVAQAGARRGDDKHQEDKSALARSKRRRDRETVVLATGSFSLAEGRDGAVLLRLTPAGRQKLAHARHHPIAAKIILSVKGGKMTSMSVLAT